MNILFGFIFFAIVITTLFFISKKLNKELKEKERRLIEQADKEFAEGKVFVPIDKRDFENFEDFAKASENVPILKSKIENIDKDFKNFEVGETNGEK